MDMLQKLRDACRRLRSCVTAGTWVAERMLWTRQGQPVSDTPNTQETRADLRSCTAPTCMSSINVIHKPLW